jgi:uncharacterized Fe-S cluster-containing MiaB family protein
MIILFEISRSINVKIAENNDLFRKVEDAKEYSRKIKTYLLK